MVAQFMSHPSCSSTKFQKKIWCTKLCKLGGHIRCIVLPKAPYPLSLCAFLNRNGCVHSCFIPLYFLLLEHPCFSTALSQVSGTYGALLSLARFSGGSYSSIWLMPTLPSHTSQQPTPCPQMPSTTGENMVPRGRVLVHHLTKAGWTQGAVGQPPAPAKPPRINESVNEKRISQATPANPSWSLTPRARGIHVPSPPPCPSPPRVHPPPPRGEPSLGP